MDKYFIVLLVIIVFVIAQFLIIYFQKESFEVTELNINSFILNNIKKSTDKKTLYNNYSDYLDILVKNRITVKKLYDFSTYQRFVDLKNKNLLTERIIKSYM